jgi:hypothetical protein
MLETDGGGVSCRQRKLQGGAFDITKKYEQGDVQ